MVWVYSEVGRIETQEHAERPASTSDDHVLYGDGAAVAPNEAYGARLESHGVIATEVSNKAALDPYRDRVGVIRMVWLWVERRLHWNPDRSR